MNDTRSKRVVPEGEHLAGVAEQRPPGAPPGRAAAPSAPGCRARAPRGRRRGRWWSRPGPGRGRRPRALRRSGRRCGPRCPTGRRPCRGGAARRPRPTRRTGAARAANAIISTAPRAKLGAMSTPTSGRPAAWSRSAATRSSDQPVVPTTTCTPCCTQWATLAGDASGTENSTTTSAPPRSPQLVADVEPADQLEVVRPRRRRRTRSRPSGHRRRSRPPSSHSWPGTVAIDGWSGRVRPSAGMIRAATRPAGTFVVARMRCDRLVVHLLFIFRPPVGYPLR